jgi:hypothetical protein
MLTRTALQLITDSLKLLGAIAGDEVPITQEQQDSLLRLNELIDSWGTHAQTMIAHRRDVVTLVPGQQTYQVGPGGDLPLVPRPMALTAAAWLVPGPPATEVPVAVLTPQEDIAIAVKTLSGAWVQAVTYAPTMTGGTLTVYPVPATALSLVLYADETVAQFPDLTTAVSLAPGYGLALRTNLAVALAPEFGRPLDPLIDRAARESLADVKRQNVSLVELGMDPGLPGGAPGAYNILSDS